MIPIEVNRAKGDSIESPRMVALEAHLQRLKGVSPVRIKEFASELNLNAIKKEVKTQEEEETTESEGVAPLVCRSVSGSYESDSFPDKNCHEIDKF
ncbi:hypothetical protein U1Q18_027800 [Sarracenia purpurea var. burkii]